MRVSLYNIALILVSIVLSLLVQTCATSCKSSTNDSQICLSKAELEENGAGYATSLMRNGDPCFMNFSKERVCFVSTSLFMAPCSCDIEKCGCKLSQTNNKSKTKNAPASKRSNSSKTRIKTKDKNNGSLKTTKRPLIRNNKPANRATTTKKPSKDKELFEVCRSTKSKPCLRKNEVGDFAEFMQAGDPCFLRKGRRWCFVNKKGLTQNCSCKNKACGCLDASKVIPSPRCDGSSIPRSINSCDQKYCEPPFTMTERIKNNHTVCKYCGIARLCGSLFCQYGLNREEQKLIVDKHNELRSIVARGLESRGVGGKGQPEAANMRKLSWDDDLAEVAQTWADECEGENGIYHDSNRKTSTFEYVGQNYASKYHSISLGDKFLNEMIQLLYDEVKDFPAQNVEPFSKRKGVTGKVGHYTQIVWAETYKIGCGYIMYKKGKRFNKVLVCNYGPGGNEAGGSMYKVGKPGSLCSNGSENGLCL